MPSATKRRPPVAAAPPPAEAKKRTPLARRAICKEAGKAAAEEATPVQPASKKRRRSIVVVVGVDASATAPIDGESNKGAAAPRPPVKDPYDFDDEEEAKSLSPAGAAGSPRFLSGLLESARKMKGNVK